MIEPWAQSPKVRRWAALMALTTLGVVARLALPVSPQAGTSLETAAQRDALVTGSVVKMAGRLTPAETSLIHNASLDQTKLVRAETVGGSVGMILADARGGRSQQRRGQSQRGEFGGNTSGPADPQLDRSMRPNFNMYRRDAIETLKNHGDWPGTAKISSLAAAFPDSLVVVCEAGCRPSSDRIVYRVSKAAAPAAELAKRRLSTTSAEAGDSSTNVVATVDNTVVCIAGCYDDDRPVRGRRAENPPASQQSPRMQTAYRRPAVAPSSLPRKRSPAREVRPVELVASIPTSAALVIPTEITVRSPELLPRFVLPLQKRGKTTLEKFGAGKWSTRAKNAGNYKQVLAKVTPGIGAWETRVTRAEEDTPLSPGWAKRGSLVAREETSPKFGQLASVWQTTIVYGDGALAEGEPSPVLTWGYVIRIAP